jgi:hypothetical protein
MPDPKAPKRKMPTDIFTIPPKKSAKKFFPEKRFR